MLLSNFTTPNLTGLGFSPTRVFSPVLEDVNTFSAAVRAFQGRSDSPCTQTIEVPVWDGIDYNTCSMQTTTAPCSVNFPLTSCHTTRPGLLPQPQGMSGTAKLWIVIGITVFLTILITVVFLWVRWKLSAPRRGGKRSISVQLEKNEAKKSNSYPSSASSISKPCSESKESSKSASDKQSQLPDGERNVLDRLLGRSQINSIQTQGMQPSKMVEKKPPTDCKADGIQFVNNIYINEGRPNQQQPPATQTQHAEESPPMSPRIELESLPFNHPVRLPANQPWMHQDQSGRWVPREEGYLHPGLPPPSRVRNVGTNIHSIDQMEDARRGRRYMPGGWRH